jgi:phage-related protein
LVAGLGSGLFEIRTSLRGTIYRTLFCFDESTMVLLHAFQKKSQRAPAADLALARRRQRNLQR